MPRRLLALVLVVAACGGPTADTTTSSSPDSGLEPVATSAPLTTTSTTVATPTAPTTTSAAPPATSRAPRSVAEDARAVVMAGFGSTQLDSSTTEFLAAGGRAVIIFSRNISSADQLAGLTSDVACAAGEAVIIAIDQEPGRVDRLDAIGIPAPPLDTDREQFELLTARMAREMTALGINLDLAPIADVAQGDNPVLEGRNSGPDPEAVTERALAFMAGLEDGGVGTTAKHFPGHGLSRVDPHRDVTLIDAPLAELAETHFPPFHAAISAGVDAVMVGHPIYESIDPDSPASLSPVVLRMLREDFGFEGVAMTDGLSMAALRKIRTIEQIALEALVAGQDLLIADRPSDVPRLVATIETAVAGGELDRERLSEAANRVRRLAAELTPIACS
ncbi:MAG: glycoside hydrolase family 3 N-terminal domain-containing protein [Acidimicrobiia bacterium]